MAKKTVEMKKGPTYYIDEYSDKFHVYKNTGAFSGRVDVGITRKMEDALSLIRSDSGQEIKEIR